jgi:hypothetical protein
MRILTAGILLVGAILLTGNIPDRTPEPMAAKRA